MKMNLFKKHRKKFAWTAALLLTAVAGWCTQQQWMPHAKEFIAFIQNKKTVVEETDEKPAHLSPDTITLSPMAWKNIGLVVGTVDPTDFVETISVPAIVVERPGRSQINISAPMTGVVTRIYPLEREGINPGQSLFDLRLTHEDVVTAQENFLTQLQVSDAAEKELSRLQRISEGVIPKKRIIEQEYKRNQAFASLKAMRQSLLLHGISEAQVRNIERTRELLQEITVTAPPYSKHERDAEIRHQYHVQKIMVNLRQNVQAGELLGSLADHSLLYVEGKGFSENAKQIVATCQVGTTLSVVPTSGSISDRQELKLKVQSVADGIDEKSRTLSFYMPLPNQILQDSASESSAHKFVAWKYRPGERMQVRLPTSAVMKNKIVLPAEAVVVKPLNAYIFEQNGDNFDRTEVHVLYRDKEIVVLENDGQLVGSVIAMNGAYEMDLELKNRSGGPIDPHAGHSH